MPNPIHSRVPSEDPDDDSQGSIHAAPHTDAATPPSAPIASPAPQATTAPQNAVEQPADHAAIHSPLTSSHVPSSIFARLQRYLPYVALGMVALNEPLASSILFPIVGFYVAFLKGLPLQDAGHYSGLLMGAYQLGQIIGCQFWGHWSDRYGRRNVLLCGLLFTSGSLVLFGMSSSFWLCLVARGLQGIMCCNNAILKSVVGELTLGKGTEALGFSLYAGFWGVGMIIGYVIGGVLYDPVKQSSPAEPHHLHFLPLNANATNSPLVHALAQHPALLPCAIIASYSALTFLVALVFLKETNRNAQPLMTWWRVRRWWWRRAHGASHGSWHWCGRRTEVQAPGASECSRAGLLRPTTHEDLFDDEDEDSYAVPTVGTDHQVSEHGKHHATGDTISGGHGAFACHHVPAPHPPSTRRWLSVFTRSTSSHRKTPYPTTPTTLLHDAAENVHDTDEPEDEDAAELTDRPLLLVPVVPSRTSPAKPPRPEGRLASSNTPPPTRQPPPWCGSTRTVVPASCATSSSSSAAALPPVSRNQTSPDPPLHPAPPTPTTRVGLLRYVFANAAIRRVFAMYMCIASSDAIFLEVLPLWTMAPISHGCLGQSTDTIGLLLMATGAYTLFANIIYRWLPCTKRCLLLTSVSALVVSLILVPLIPRAFVSGAARLGVLLIVLLLRSVAATWAFTLTFVAVAQVSPLNCLGAVTSLSHACMSLCRTVHPPLMTALFSWTINSAHTYPFDGALVFWLALLYLLLALRLGRVIPYDTAVYNNTTSSQEAGELKDADSILVVCAATSSSAAHDVLPLSVSVVDSERCSDVGSHSLRSSSDGERVSWMDARCAGALRLE